MIRLAQEVDFPPIADNEVLVRICALRHTYGPNASFIRYYADDDGSLLAIMDGVGLLHTSMLSDEWGAFLAMNPDICSIHCARSVGEELMRSGCWQGRVGDTMKFVGDAPQIIDDSVCITPYLPAVYELLKEHFPGISSFDSWYPDVSHRVRHGNSHISVVLDGDTVVSTAMTVAETDTAVILGQVATHPTFRLRGLAAKCIKSTIAQCEGKELYILPIDEIAMKLYAKLGFKVVDGWAEVERT